MSVEGHAQIREPALRHGGRSLLAGAVDPDEELVDGLPQLALTLGQSPFDADLGVRKQGGGRHHRLLENERLQPVQSGGQGACFLIQEPGRLERGHR